MSVDTKQKRASTLYYGRYGRLPTVIVSGTLDTAERKAILKNYASPVVPPPQSDINTRQNKDDDNAFYIIQDII